MIAKRSLWVVTALAVILVGPDVGTQVSSGTAFSVASEFLVTTQHVVAGCSSVGVIAGDVRRTGSVVDADADTDLALLHVTGMKGSTARLRNPRAVRLGEAVMVFGFPLTGALSSGGNFTSGLVSALRGLQDKADELQITAPVQPGNSGGPLMDASGLVIGVVQSKLDALRVMGAIGDVPQNVNFAISLGALAKFLVKNKVPVRDGAAAAPLDTAKVAEMAQSFTYRVECPSKVRQAEVFLDKKAKPLAPNDLKKLAVGTVFQDCEECPEMIVIAPGSFVMGWKSDEWHTVSIQRVFAVGKFEVTFAQWQACVEARGCSHRPDDRGWGYGSQPVINVSWVDAKQYTIWLSQKTGKSYRLLTDAEWEYVARAGTTTSFYWGNNYSEVCQFETVNQGVGGCGEQKPSLVGRRRPNPFGVHDMLGNIQEWVEDCKNVKLYGAPADGSAWMSGDCDSRIFRGGNWDTRVRTDFWALRWTYGATARNSNLGFRVARD